MTHKRFQEVTLEILKNYWRIKAANALYHTSRDSASGLLEYTNVPTVGVAANNFASESVETAVTALRVFVARRLPRDLFFALIAEFETRLATRLISLAESPDGTLGTLQRRIQSRVRFTAALIEDFNEIRERRNAMIHHGDIANANYVAVAAVVRSRISPFSIIAAVGDRVSPTEAYLAYAADVLVRYSQAAG